MASEPHRRRRVLTYGLLSGAVYGILQGLANSSVSAGVVNGLLFGTVMGAAHYASLRANAHLGGLGLREQRMVMAAVRRGRAVADPALAGPAIDQARNVQLTPGGQRLGHLLAWGLLAVSVVGLGLSVWSGSVSGVIAGAFSGVVWVIILLVGPPLERHFQDRARAAEVANRRVVDSSATAGQG